MLVGLTFEHHQRGVSLIELLIGLAIVGFLVTLGVPSYTQWIQNSQIRNAAESLQNGLQLARSNAVRRNERVRFTLTGTGAAADWQIGCPTATANCATNIQSWDSGEGATNVRIGVATATGAFGTALGQGAGMSPGVGVTFDGNGRVASVGADIARIDVLNPKLAVADQRRLVVVIGAGGSIRMCDPAAPTASGRRC